MKIIFLPQRGDGVLDLSKAGEVVVINGDVVDLSALGDGESLPSVADDAEPVYAHPMIAKVERVSGELVMQVILPHGAAPSTAVAFPVPLVDVPDGLVVLPT